MKKKPVAYPIKPRHLDTKEEPKGFDTMLEYGERVIFWALIQYCQYKGNWESFTWDDFMKFIDDQSIKINGPVRSGVIFFSGQGINFLFDKIRVGEKGVLILTPTHFCIATYFLWNPCQFTEKSK